MAADGAEVAEDYRLALEDLSSNGRFEISNLTLIARENTEHALAIADTLQQHILKASPSKKLPALYVMDSIVKNVGTPYTLYFGRNLFKIFMESYAVSDHAIRKRMEEMLKTWKEPVAGSMDMRPVFSAELVRPIENALMKVRAATMPPQGQLPGRPRSAMLPHRDTPTPPGMRGPGVPPPGTHTPQPYQQYPNGSQPGQPMPSQSPYPPQQQAPFYQPQGNTQSGNSTPTLASILAAHGLRSAAAPAGISVESLSNDIQNLIVAMKTEFSQNPHDASVQNRLRALLDLQGVVQRTSLPQDQLELIKNKVTELAAVTIRASSSRNSTPVPAAVPALAHSAPPAAVPVAPAPTASGPGAPVTLDALLGTGALAALVARQSATPQSSNPNPPYPNAAIRSPPPTQRELPKPAAAPAGAQNPNATTLLDRLRLAGMLTPTNAGPAAPPPLPMPPTIASLLASSKQGAGRAGFSIPSNTRVDSAALKQQFLPDVIATLYEGLGPPCTQCGRRFKNDAEGKKRKTVHMDWHFRVHQRSTEAEKRGMHRSWYVDQQDWLRSREAIDADHVPNEAEVAAEAFRAAEAAKPKYIPVPDPNSGINNVCPICQERFENKWLDTAQEWVWLDTVLVGNRAYHASCHAEATRDREGTPGLSRKTPEPVLGKRKAETGISSPKIRSMKTSA